MKLFKKRKTEGESYWKSFTDIMAGLLLIILLIMMLLLLYMTQMKKEDHKEDFRYEYQYNNYQNNSNNKESDHLADEMYDRPSRNGGAGGGEGVDDPGDNVGEGQYTDIGHDKTAVFVTVVDEETKNVIKKSGILFELYSSQNAKGGLKTLHTYYPDKIEYKQYETTEDGTFYLPEKITNGWYSLHNLRAPKGYSFADDVNFEINKSLDWAEPFMVTVPMSPSKASIYIHDVDADSNKNVAGTTYEVEAADDIITLDGTVRYKKGAKVDEFVTDKTGKGTSKKLYYGDYIVRQKTAAPYYSLNKTSLDVTLEYTEKEAEVYEVKCQKTKAELLLIDDYTEEPISGATFSVTGREDAVTDTDGKLILTDLEKGASYDLTLKSLPEPYKSKKDSLSFTVDHDGCISGKAVYSEEMTAYIVRLSASVRDTLFGNELTSAHMRLYDSQDNLVDEWDGIGTEYEVENLEPGTYILEAGGRKSTRVSIELKDQGGIQTISTNYWTAWDTITVAAIGLVLLLLAALVVSLIRRFRRKGSDE